MSIRGFSLKPFPSAGPLPDLNITVSAERRSNILAVSYTLCGPLTELVVPAQTNMPARRDALWEETCFELFLGIRNSPGYWEFNISPAGHWNVYRFKSYREGMQEEPAITALPFSIESKSDSFCLSLELALDKIVPVEQDLEAAISAVVKSINGKLTYWALIHPDAKPDFHLRDGFVIVL
jgi:hypothetical protein